MLEWLLRQCKEWRGEAIGQSHAGRLKRLATGCNPDFSRDGTRTMIMRTTIAWECDPLLVAAKIVQLDRLLRQFTVF